VSTSTSDTENTINEEELFLIVRKSVKEVCKYIMDSKSLRAIIKNGQARAKEYVAGFKGIHIRGQSGAFRKQIGVLFIITTPLDLNHDTVTEELRTIFAQHGHELSPQASIKVCKTDRKWQIYDKKAKTTYQILKEGNCFQVSQNIHDIAKREAKEWKKKLQEVQQVHGERSWDDGICPLCGGTDLFFGEVPYAKVQAEIERMRRKLREARPSP
jgi:hypothetical protein